jgi:hypothetical protein
VLIATRVLKLRQPDGEREVPIRIFAPEPDANSWICRFEIGWPEAPLRRYAGGVDAVQALHLALQMIGVLLYTSEYHEAGKLMFQESGRGYGFPITKNLRDLLIGDDARFEGS